MPPDVASMKECQSKCPSTVCRQGHQKRLVLTEFGPITLTCHVSSSTTTCPLRLQASYGGLGYRFSKDLNDKDVMLCK